MEVAGFAPEDLDITVKENELLVNGKSKKDEDAAKYLHRGIARRAFERRFQLADHIKVAGASLANGLLHVDLVREIPEAMKPRKIEIAGGAAGVMDEKAACHAGPLTGEAQKGRRSAPPFFHPLCPFDGRRRSLGR